MTLGEIVKQYRTNNNLTMDEFSKRSGLSKGYVSMLEKNFNPKTKREIIPTFSTMELIAKAMLIDVQDLITMLYDEQPVKWGLPTYLFNLPPDAEKLIENYSKLNISGKEKANEYVEDLTTISKYTEEVI